MTVECNRQTDRHRPWQWCWDYIHWFLYQLRPHHWQLVQSSWDRMLHTSPAVRHTHLQTSAKLAHHWHVSPGFIQTLKHWFPRLSRTCKDQIPGFSKTQKTRFKDFPVYTPFTNMVAWGQKVHIPNQFSMYLHYSKQAQMQYLWLY